MEEKTFKTLNGTGALNIVLGVVGIVTGVAGGVLLIVFLVKKRFTQKI
mgnify:CR=1 FL=1